MDIKPWPVEKDYTFPSAWVDASGATVDDGSYLDEGLYERAMKEAYAARLRVAVEALQQYSGASDPGSSVAAQALADIGELPTE
jgi:hypothetical protein